MVSTNFINECKNRANANRLGKIIVDGLTSPITNSDNLQSFEIDSGCYADGNIIGTVYAKCLNANFIASQDNLVDKPVQVQIGVKYANLSTEYINLGKYIVERPNNEITAQYSQITAYSSLYTKLDDKYVCNIDYSKGNVTLKDLYVDVCNQLGLIPNTTTFTNSTIPIVANPFTNGEKNRTVLQIIAKISCSFIDIDNDSNKIDLCWLSSNTTPDYTFNFGDYVNVEGGQIICGPINCLIIKNSQIDDENVTIKDDESIKQNGEHSITISEDYILHNAELRQQAINSIWNKVKGMKYVDCKLTTYYGKPFLKLGDKIRIYINKTEYFDTYVLKHKFTYDGSFTSIIESPALTEQEIKNKQDTNLAKLLSETQIDVNKQLKKITASVSEIDSTLNSITTTNKTVSNKNSLYIEDALKENALEFRVKGKCEQETRSGKNRFYSKPMTVTNWGITATYNIDGTIKITGKVTSGWVWLLCCPSGLSFNNGTPSQSGPIKTDDNYIDGTCHLQLIKTGTGGHGCQLYSKSKYLVNGPLSYTSTDGINCIAMYVGGTGETIDVILKPQIEEGTSFTEYEQPGPMPSPIHPSEINTIKGIENLLKDVNSDEGDGNYWVGYSTFDKNTRTLTSSTTKTTENFITHKISGVKSNTTYTLFLEIKSNGYVKSADLFLYNNQTKGIKTIRIDSLSTEFTKYRFTFTTNKDIDYSTNSVVRIDNNGSTQEGTEAVLTVRNVMLVEGTADEYVPYGNWLVEKITGKNLAITNEYSNNRYNFTLDQNTCRANRTYMLSFIPSNDFDFNIRLNNANGQKILNGYSAKKDVKFKFKFTPNEDCKFYINNWSGGFNVKELMIVEGTDEEYEPYKNQNVLINLKNNELCSNKDLSVRDELVVNETETFIDKKIGKAIFDGSDDEGWVLANAVDGTTRGHIYPLPNSKNIVYTNHYCNKNTVRTTEEYTYYKEYSFISSGGYYFQIENSRLSSTDLNGFKAYLKANPVTIYYELATPEKISLDKVDIPLFENINNLTLLEDLETDTSVKYLLKTPISEDYITRHEANAKIKITKDSITQLANETETNLNSVNQKYAETKLASDGLSISVADIQKNVNSQQEDISNINSNVNKTNSELNNLKNNINSTNEVVTKMNYSFGTKELTINKETDPVNTGISNKGMIVRNYTTIKTVANDKGLGTDDLIVTNTAQIGYLKFMKSTDENGKLVTDIHHLVSNIQQVSDLVGD